MNRPEPKDEEVTFEELGVEKRSIISRTDLNGIITFANKAFCTLSGYDKDELIGKPHSIIRHPDMPKAAFKEMWDTIKSNQKWHGFIKNLRKDGKYYWVIVRIEPIFDENGKKVGYVGVRRKPEREIIQEMEEKYREMRANEKK